MEIHHHEKGAFYKIPAPDFRAPAGGTITIGVTVKDLAAGAARGLRTHIGQFYATVAPGLIRAKHVYEGFRRPMLVNGDADADGNKLAFTWAAKFDGRMTGEHGHDLERIQAPANRVFAVYISINQMQVEFPDVFGWAEHWTWIHRDPIDKHAPDGHADRYERCLWSAKD